MLSYNKWPDGREFERFTVGPKNEAHYIWQMQSEVWCSSKCHKTQLCFYSRFQHWFKSSCSLQVGLCTFMQNYRRGGLVVSPLSSARGGWLPFFFPSNYNTWIGLIELVAIGNRCLWKFWGSIKGLASSTFLFQNQHSLDNRKAP